MLRRVLLTNDDGFDAPGMAILAQIANQIAEEIWIVAPALDRSGVSNAISVREPLRVVPRGQNKFAVYGTPADCVALALGNLMKDTLPDLILSGVNNGSNIGVEVILSGTVGAATTGMLSGIPSIALSQCVNDGEEIKWQTALTYAPKLITTLVDKGWSNNTCLNINFPNITADQVQGVKLTQQNKTPFAGFFITETHDPKGDCYYWLRTFNKKTEQPEGSDSQAINNGFISVTPIDIDRTAHHITIDLENN